LTAPPNGQQQRFSKDQGSYEPAQATYLCVIQEPMAPVSSTICLLPWLQGPLTAAQQYLLLLPLLQLLLPKLLQALCCGPLAVRQLWQGSS